MNKVLKIGICVGLVTSLVSCGTSEHFMQDDVYNTRTPVMPPGTDLNDVTDYAAFVARKEQTETPPERTTYVSPRDYRDFFYYSQFMYYGYPPYAIAPGLSYVGYGYPNHYSGFGNSYYSSIGFGNFYGYNPYGYNPYGGYYGTYGYNPYGYGYNPYWNSSYYNNFGGGGYYGGGNYYGGGYTYTQKGKPNTPGNLANSHAGSSSGRMGSTSNGEVVYYPNKMMINPGIPSTTPYNGVGRNPAIRIDNGGRIDNGAFPTVNNGRTGVAVNRTPVTRPTTSDRPTISAPRGDYQRPANQNVNMNSNQNPNTRTINNSTTNFPARTSTPSGTIRSGGSSGGGGSVPSTGGGGRTGGRR